MKQIPQLHYHRLLRIPSYLLRVGRLLGIFLVVFVLILIFVPWQQTATGSGQVIAYSPTDRQQDIHAPIDGRLGKWFVQEGAAVKAGDPIVELADNDPHILTRLQTEKQALLMKLTTYQEAAALARVNAERQKKLYEAGISARRTYEQAEIEQKRYQGEVANVQIELANINVRLARQETQLIKAPRDGYILRRMTGQESVFVKAGTSIAVLVPDTASRAVELWVHGIDAPLIEPGQTARLQFEGWPAIQFSGWPSVAVGTFGGQVAVVDAAGTGQQGLFRVIVVPAPHEAWPEARYLRQGVRVNGWILLSRVKLGFELWRRFNGFPLSRKNAAE